MGKHSLTEDALWKKGGEIKQLCEGQRQREVPSFLLHLAEPPAVFCRSNIQMRHTRFMMSTLSDVPVCSDQRLCRQALEG